MTKSAKCLAVHVKRKTGLMGRDKRRDLRRWCSQCYYPLGLRDQALTLDQLIRAVLASDSKAKQSECAGGTLFRKKARRAFEQKWSVDRSVVRLSQTEVPMRQIGDRVVLVQRSALAAYRALDEIRAAAGNIAA